MNRALVVVTGLALLALGGLLGLYGLFAVHYRGDSGGSADTYVTFVGHQFDADLVRAISLVIAGMAIFCGIVFVRRPRHE